jgi:hypothetical protein
LTGIVCRECDPGATDDDLTDIRPVTKRHTG